DRRSRRSHRLRRPASSLAGRRDRWEEVIMSTTGSISVSGLLGGTAGQIDTTTLIANLMQAAAVPQKQLQDQLTTVQTVSSALQTVNTRMTNVLTAAQALTDPAAWTA